jgi:uncharacterized C2H2 Zn-finger protein
VSGSPGSHGRNWSPAKTIGDYVRNCEAGLEPRSDRRAAKLMGWSRMYLRRVLLMTQIPDDLFDALLAQDKLPSQRELANIALAMRGHDASETERCPQCGFVLRRRLGYTAASAAIVNKWIDDRAEHAEAHAIAEDAP